MLDKYGFLNFREPAAIQRKKTHFVDVLTADLADTGYPMQVHKVQGALWFGSCDYCSYYS